MTLPMRVLAQDDTADFYVRPGDVITVLEATQTYTVLGATLNNTSLPLNGEHVNLVQALARSGGLLDQRADPVGVFLLRFEPATVVTAVGAVSAAHPHTVVPVVFHVDLHEIGGYFLASRLDLQDGDIIYAANASGDALLKFFTLVGTIAAPATGALVLTHR